MSYVGTTLQRLSPPQDYPVVLTNPVPLPNLEPTIPVEVIQPRPVVKVECKIHSPSREEMPSPGPSPSVITPVPRCGCRSTAAQNEYALEIFRETIRKFNQTDPYNTYLKKMGCGVDKAQYAMAVSYVQEKRQRLQTFIEEIVNEQSYTPLEAPYDPMTGKLNRIPLDSVDVWSRVFLDLTMLTRL